MKKLLYLAVTFVICMLTGMGKIWAGFSLAICVLMFNRIGKSVIWEIPMGVLSCSIVADLFPEDTANVLRILIPIGAVLIAFSSPDRLMPFFCFAVISLLYKNIYAVSAIWAGIWYGGRFLFVKSYNEHSTTKRNILQGNYFTKKPL